VVKFHDNTRGIHLKPGYQPKNGVYYNKGRTHTRSQNASLLRRAAREHLMQAQALAKYYTEQGEPEQAAYFAGINAEHAQGRGNPYQKELGL
jgi:hypothetical protein